MNGFVMDSGRGLLVVIEGIDGTGKTTLARGLHGRLRALGLPSTLTREPTDGRFGTRLRESFMARVRLPVDEELGLFVDDRREHVRATILPAIERGEVVVCDRYYLSTAAYQGARGKDPAEIRRLNESFAPRPDLVLMLDLPVREAVERIRRKRGESPNNFEGEDYLERVASIFDGFRDPFIVRLDAMLPEEELLERATKEVMSLRERGAN